MAASQRQKRLDKVGLYLCFAVVALFAFFPIYWMLITSLTPADQVFKFPPRLFPTDLTFDHYASFFDSSSLLRYFRNSLLVTTATAFGSILVSSYAAYSFSKFRYTGRRALMFLILSAQMFPQALLLIALYLMFDDLGLLNSYWSLILAFTTFTLPLCIWMLKLLRHHSRRPDRSRQSGWREPLAIIHRILMPVAAPALVSTGLFAFIRGWNDYIYALTLAGPQKMTLPPGLVLTYIGEFQTSWPNLMASSFIVSLPIVIAFLFMQRYIAGGLIAGAVKG
jgi:multiple sugar transport system permease protein